MCGRFTLTVDPSVVQETLEIGRLPAEAAPRYNIAPTQAVAVVTDGDEREVSMFRWGLVPTWAQDISIGNRLINARAETVAEKPSFRAAFAKRRCLVLADGFYEWERLEGKRARKQPYHFHLENGDPFAFAGLWEVWRGPDQEHPLYTCTLITTTANDVVSPVHDRSPVMLTGDALWAWLHPDTSKHDLHDLLRPYPAVQMAAYPVSTDVNSPANEGAELVVAIA